jgi:hypothetical protein
MTPTSYNKEREDKVIVGARILKLQYRYQRYLSLLRSLDLSAAYDPKSLYSRKESTPLLNLAAQMAARNDHGQGSKPTRRHPIDIKKKSPLTTICDQAAVVSWLEDGERCGYKETKDPSSPILGPFSGPWAGADDCLQRVKAGAPQRSITRSDQELVDKYRRRPYKRPYKNPSSEAKVREGPTRSATVSQCAAPNVSSSTSNKKRVVKAAVVDLPSRPAPPPLRRIKSGVSVTRISGKEDSAGF